ncbi:MAG: Slp family lipoprotein [Ectothiorhodospiraceae bacterium]|nr:Slp family lipoprotein [Ectothiorhodospiraceae bacterium]
MTYRLLALLSLPLFLAACATGPGYTGAHINTELQPRAAAQASDGGSGETVVWGGRIIQAQPLEDATQLEVLAYPLQRNQQPDTGKSSQGRFLGYYPGYLEPADYASDRLITVTGPLREAHTGRVGEADYRYPVINADDIHLWPEQQQVRRDEPRVRFGVGVMLHR